MKKIKRAFAVFLVFSLLLVNLTALAGETQSYVVDATLATILCTADEFSTTTMMRYGDTRALFALAVYLDCKLDDTVKNVLPEDLPTFFIGTADDGYIYITLFYEKLVWLLMVNETSGTTIASSLDGQNLTFSNSTMILVMDSMVENGMLTSYEKITLTEISTAMDALSEIIDDAS